MPMKSSSSSTTRARNRPTPSRSSKLAPAHPGEIVRADFFAPHSLTAYRVAKDLGITLPRLNDILLGKRGISPEMAVLLAAYFGTSDAFFMNLQCDYDRRIAQERLRFKLRKIKPLLRSGSI
ncbi:MAG: HigA family addiction module antitoxin [Steroidobacteraceae bacterium]